MYLEGYIIDDDIIAESQGIKEIMNLAVRLGRFNSTVLITGESGVGKEIVVRVIHNASARAGSLIKVNCGAIPENLLESELFGYEQGAFTGADRGGKPGLFELAENGTIFLDEIGELPLCLQVKLLRVLQEGEIIRLGGKQQIKINTRVVAASNRNLEAMISRGEFREDLYYRLNVVPIYVPPLRERKRDIIPLLKHYLEAFNEKYKTQKIISTELLNYLKDYEWPGNIRQLKNIIERLVVTVPERILMTGHLPVHFKRDFSSIKPGLDLNREVERLEKNILERALTIASTTREIAEIIGVSQPTVVRKMKKYNISTGKH